uniref:hypothetical protein n=1 Tax=Methylobacterium sp. B34 TaxID=95563 RepID=UPI000344BC84|nr:hypothetical protein [Methylobacterium sp. B34]
MKIQLRLRKKRRETSVKVRTFKDLHARDRRQGSAPDHVAQVASAPHRTGQGTEAAASQTGQDIVTNHVLV